MSAPTQQKDIGPVAQALLDYGIQMPRAEVEDDATYVCSLQQQGLDESSIVYRVGKDRSITYPGSSILVTNAMKYWCDGSVSASVPILQKDIGPVAQALLDYGIQMPRAEVEDDATYVCSLQQQGLDEGLMVNQVGKVKSISPEGSSILVTNAMKYWCDDN